MLKWFFSSPMRISIFLLIAYVVLVILVYALFFIMYALFGGSSSFFVILWLLLGTSFVPLLPLLFTIGTFILVPWLYKKFGFWSCESRSMLAFSIGLAGILGGVLAAWNYHNIEPLSMDMASFYDMMSWGGQSFWLTVLLQGTSFLVRSPPAKIILNRISLGCCLVSFLLLFRFPPITGFGLFMLFLFG